MMSPYLTDGGWWRAGLNGVMMGWGEKLIQLPKTREVGELQTSEAASESTAGGAARVPQG